MSINRNLVVLILLVLGGANAFWFLNNSTTPILVSNARAVHVSGNIYSVFLNLENTGNADVITEILAENAERAFIMGGATDEGLAIPQGAKPSLSSDGAHIMLRLLGDKIAEGTLLPFIIKFENAGSVAVKAVIQKAGDITVETDEGDAKMDHSSHGGDAIFNLHDSASAPKIEMSVTPEADNKWAVEVTTDNFNFFEPKVEPLKHKDGQGHGHLYLNGLKLQRMYNGSAIIGALPIGKHTVSVTLNTNDHQAYAVHGKVVSASVDIEVKY